MKKKVLRKVVISGIACLLSLATLAIGLDIVPETDGGASLGTSSKRWATVEVRDSITVGDTVISEDGISLDNTGTVAQLVFTNSSLLIGSEGSITQSYGQVSLGHGTTNLGPDNIIIGRGATSGGDGVNEYRAIAIGLLARGDRGGVAIGYDTVALQDGVALGSGAEAIQQKDIAIGQNAYANSHAQVLGGYGAEARTFSTAIGNYSEALNNSLAIGYQTVASNKSFAIGYKAEAGQTNIAFGHFVKNDIPDTARLRGSLYLDGGTGIHWRATFNVGNFESLTSDGINLFYFNSTGGVEQITSM